MEFNDNALPARFWSKVKVSETGCWEWTGCIRGRYAYFRMNGRGMNGHRVSFAAKHGEIPNGLVLDHLCRNTICVNPAHLEAVTFKENILRGNGFAGINARRVLCKHGHHFDAVRVIKSGPSRVCSVCRIRRKQESVQRKKDRLAGS